VLLHNSTKIETITEKSLPRKEEEGKEKFGKGIAKLIWGEIGKYSLWPS